MTDRALQAYAAYGDSMNWKDELGNRIPQFSELTERKRAAWDAACGAALQHWLDNDFHARALDDEEMAFTLNVFSAGRAKYPDKSPLEWLRVAIASFIVKMIDPVSLDNQEIPTDGGGG